MLFNEWLPVLVAHYNAMLLIAMFNCGWHEELALFNTSTDGIKDAFLLRWSGTKLFILD